MSSRPQPIGEFFSGLRARAATGKRRENPETPITRGIRQVLRVLRIPHFKHWAGQFSEKGIPDLIGTIPPHGRALYIEVKKPGGTLRPEQIVFLEDARAAGAVAIVATEPTVVIRALAAAGHAGAKAMASQLPPEAL